MGVAPLRMAHPAPSARGSHRYCSEKKHLMHHHRPRASPPGVVPGDRIRARPFSQVSPLSSSAIQGPALTQAPSLPGLVPSRRSPAVWSLHQGSRTRGAERLARSTPTPVAHCPPRAGHRLCFDWKISINCETILAGNPTASGHNHRNSGRPLARGEFTPL
jgi:hypothetical protein